MRFENRKAKYKYLLKKKKNKIRSKKKHNKNNLIRRSDILDLVFVFIDIIN